MQSFKPGEVWLDTNGKLIQAHGGGILFDQGTYYWFGENKDADTIQGGIVEFQLAEPIGISCYSSTDLYHWQNEGIVLSAAQVQAKDTAALQVIERPKVLFNAQTQQYVMWFHADHGTYKYAQVGIATSGTPTGPYDYRGSLRPAGSDARDMTLYQDDDGSAYVIFSSEWNQTLWVARLTADYLSTTEEVTRNLIGQHREAPAIFKRDDRYYLITSGCTGWDSNEANYATAPAVLGPWTPCGNPCSGPNADKTFFAQSTFVLPVAQMPGAFIFMADRWKKENLRDSRYVWLPVRFVNNQLQIEWHDEWDYRFLFREMSVI